MSTLRSVARFTAYAIAFLLAAVWLSSGIASLEQPLYDLGRARIGDAIIAFAAGFALSPAATLKLACMLAGLKLLIGTYFLLSIIVATYERLRWRTSGDEMLELGLFVSALASIVAVSPLLGHRPALGVALGELLLCVIASGLAGFARAPRMHRAARGRWRRWRPAWLAGAWRVSARAKPEGRLAGDEMP